jgi:hypothetical protein
MMKSAGRGMLIGIVAFALASCGSSAGKRANVTPKANGVTTTVATTVPALVPAAPTSTPTTRTATTPAPTVVAPTPTRIAPVPHATTTSAPSVDPKTQAVAKVRALGRLPGEFAGFGNGRLGAVTTSRGTADGKGVLVLFFDRGRYLRSDTPQESVDAQIASTGTDTVTVSYRLYMANDPFCCPTGGLAKVRFHLGAQGLVALDPIPPISGALHR